MTEVLPTPRKSPDARALVGAGESALTAARGLEPTPPDDSTHETPSDKVLPRMRAAILDTVVDREPAAEPTSSDDEASTNPTPPITKQTLAPDTNDPLSEVWQLVERAQNGDNEAFDGIYRRYLDTVFRFAYFRVGNKETARDITAETFFRALKRIKSLAWQGRDPGAWLITITRNLVADWFKSGRYRFEVATGDVLDADQTDRVSAERDPEQAIVEHLTNIDLLTAVNRLNPEQRECLVLRFLQGYSVAETAQIMGKNEGAVKALQYRAVRSVHRFLPKGFEP